MPPYPDSPDRDEMQVLGDYLFDHQPQLPNRLEHAIDHLYLLLFKFRNRHERPSIRASFEQQLLTIPEPERSEALTYLTGSRDEDAPGLDMKAVRGRWCVMRRDAAERVLRDAPDRLEVARCPACDRILNTPRARQCFVCGHDWHEEPAPE